jgi:hypothetical protein
MVGSFQTFLRYIYIITSEEDGEMPINTVDEWMP